MSVIENIKHKQAEH